MKRLFTLTFAGLILVLSGACLVYAWVVLEFDRGVKAGQRGDFEAALAHLEAAGNPFEKIPWLPWAFKEDYQAIVFNQIGILYQAGEYEKVVEKLEQAAREASFMSETAAHSFWLGNVLVRRAVANPEPEEVGQGLQSAVAEYQKGLAAHPEDWDLKYNFELTKQILTQRDQDRKKTGEKVKSILEKLQPTDEKSRQELPAEKRG
jgi:tetratricopeptide (TPR) repeat protein